MIKSVGIDIFSRNRMMFLNNNQHDPFLMKSFTEKERKESSEKGKLTYLTGRFSAKEAVYKCIGGLIYLDFKPGEIEIINNDKGMPIVTLYGETLNAAKSLGNYNIHVSISYESDTAISFAILEVEEK